MSMLLKGRLAAAVLAALICISCGDVYRPTIVPEPVTPPNPQNFHAAFTANTNGTANPGSALQIDVSGDSKAGTTNVGIAPVHLAVQAGASSIQTRIWAANPGSDSVSVFNAEGSVGAITSATTINLPLNPPPDIHPMPVFVHSTETTTMYVANFAYNTVTAIATGTNAIAATIPVGTNPWAMAETPDGHKLYVVNNGSNDVTSINTTDRSVVVPTISAGTSPQWAMARSDSHRVYVLASDGTVTDIDSEFTSGTVDTVLAKFSVATDTGLPVVFTNFFFYDNRLNRLHIPFMTPAAGGGVLYEDAIYSVATDPPALLNVVQVAGPVTAPCAQCAPISVTALQDGTRAYVSSYTIDANTTNCASTQVVGYSPQNCLATQVAVINELNNTVSKVLQLPEVALSPLNTNVNPPALVTTTVDCSNPAVTRFRMMTVSSTDSSKVYVSSCDVGGVMTVRTTDDTFVTTLTMPVSLLNPIQYNSGNPTPFPPPQSPLFLIPGP